MFEAQIERAKALIVSPQSAWETIDSETVEARKLFKTWVLPLAAIPALAGFVHLYLFGTYALRSPVFGLLNALGMLALTLLGVYGFACIINLLAPYFGTKKNFNQALKLAAYSPVALWLSGIFMLVPILSFLPLLGGLYSLYLLYLGLPVLMAPAPKKAMPYTLATILAAIVLSMVLGQIAHSILPDSGAGLRGSSRQNLTQKEQKEALENALKDGDLGGMMAALSGERGAADLAAPTAFKSLAPSSLAGLKRVSLEMKTLDVPVKTIVLKARYEGSGERSITLNVMQSPGVNFLKSMAGLSGIARSVKKDDGSFEQLLREKDKLIMQSWDAQSAKGTLAWSYKNFIVSVAGQDMSPKSLKKASMVISTADLDRMARQ
jgi:Yip1 domain